MPQTGLAGRVVFGGGGGGGSSTPAQAPKKYTSSYPELKGKEYKSQAEVTAAEQQVDFEKSNEGKFAQFKADIDAAASASTAQKVQAEASRPTFGGVGNIVGNLLANEGGLVGYNQGGNVTPRPTDSGGTLVPMPGAPSGAGAKTPLQSSANVDAIGDLQMKLQAVQAVAIPTFEGDSAKTYEDKANKYKTTKMSGVRDALVKEQTKRTAEMAAASREMTSKAMTDPSALVTKADVAQIDPNAAGTTIAEGTGQLGAATTMQATTAGPAQTAQAAAPITAATVDTTTTGADISQAMQGVQAVQGQVSPEAIAQAATMDPTTTAVGNLQEAQGTAIMMNNPVQREIQQGELISGVADAQKAAAFTEQVQAAQATPSAQTMVQNQLAGLMQDFEGKDPPAWAAGALRNATAQMAARGLGSSSIAGQALVQAAMESALPIAMADAQTQTQFEMQNLSNRQQRAMLAAQQRANSARIADVANMNFTAEQQIALENSRTANTMNLQNLSNKQAMVMAQAASISQLEQQNLSNAQQAAVQNAQAFLQMDMQNLSNQQQTEMFKAQSIAQSIFTDAAAENAAKQFNASSENQTKQFMANMQTQVSQFNASQINAQNQFNAGQKNAAAQFNAQVQNQRDQFNAQNQLVVAQANAQWRQNVVTINTAAQNEANMQAAQAANGITAAAMDQLWQRERDIMDYSFKAAESSKERALELVLADKKYDEYAKARADAEETAQWTTLTNILLS